MLLEEAFGLSALLIAAALLFGAPAPRLPALASGLLAPSSITWPDLAAALPCPDDATLSCLMIPAP